MACPCEIGDLPTVKPQKALGLTANLNRMKELKKTHGEMDYMLGIITNATFLVDSF